MPDRPNFYATMSPSLEGQTDDPAKSVYAQIRQSMDPTFLAGLAMGLTLFRGEGGGTKMGGQWFTPNRKYAASFAERARVDYPGQPRRVMRVDVPDVEAESYRAENIPERWNRSMDARDYYLPRGIAAQARPVWQNPYEGIVRPGGVR